MKTWFEDCPQVDKSEVSYEEKDQIEMEWYDGPWYWSARLPNGKFVIGLWEPTYKGDIPDKYENPKAWVEWHIILSAENIKPYFEGKIDWIECFKRADKIIFEIGINYGKFLPPNEYKLVFREHDDHLLYDVPFENIPKELLPNEGCFINEIIDYKFD